ncbi:TPA: hypothetical protein ACKP89_003190 [Stenotrophomonas maltophilia]|uniref:hypothetical protein n=1 Tax=Stenotrophomonas maltophilia TaxID=40324 RepID=UPI000C1608BF|nr:hypothetical protein [Stenotrophomonas maltophilia]AYZ69895.1 hypothetical protein EGY09_07780 [Stenotrophomonas maltophilia]EKT4072776.1 hypothetical protein [Stenotrophomonas maltophilia]EKT4080904.1 hypothetical protein [Stenotrophomonas maltophilia]MBA0232996.1 hypothetical protein [Stenotrophomonas maltophilia]MBA0266954.1 hypothetical protein [Stenotrophomonas maltophilia]
MSRKFDLDARAERMQRKEEPFRLHGKLRSVHFLRGVMSRASMSLPAFYYFLGTAQAAEDMDASGDLPFRVSQSYLEFSTLNSLSLNCRKVFDHAAKPDLTGGNFGRLSDGVLEEHAHYWSERGSNTFEDAHRALVFLREFFREYARTDTDLLKAPGRLHKRIGLLKQHADRTAAHLSLQEYELELLDMMHVVAALVIVGEVIRSFDAPSMGSDYFNDIDAASLAAASRTFPSMRDFRLLGHVKVDQQARAYWRMYQYESIPRFFDQLEFALG